MPVCEELVLLLKEGLQIHLEGDVMRYFDTAH